MLILVLSTILYQIYVTHLDDCCCWCCWGEGRPTYCSGIPLLSPILTSPDGETLIKFVFGTIMYLRPATMAIDWGGVLLMSNSDRLVVRLVEDGIQVVMPPITLPPFVLAPDAFGSASLLARWFLAAEVVLEMFTALTTAEELVCCVGMAEELVDEAVVAVEAFASFSCKQL